MALLDKKDAPRFSPEEIAKLEQILQSKPEILPFLGIDVDMAKQEVEKARKLKNSDNDPDRAKRTEG